MAIPYDKNRGDKIIIKQVPFHKAEGLPSGIGENGIWFEQLFDYIKTIPRGIKITILSLFGILLVLIVIRIMRPKQSPNPFQKPARSGIAPSENEAVDNVKNIKNMAARDPEKIANLLKKWLTEEKQ